MSAVTVSGTSIIVLRTGHLPGPAHRSPQARARAMSFGGSCHAWAGSSPSQQLGIDPELGDGARDRALDRALADPEGLRDLGFAHVLEIAQHDGRPHPAWQAVQG